MEGGDRRPVSVVTITERLFHLQGRLYATVDVIRGDRRLGDVLDPELGDDDARRKSRHGQERLSDGF
jgi:hypothetical protein